MTAIAGSQDELHRALASRWLVPLAFALLVHCIPMFCLTLSPVEQMPDDFTVTVDFTDNAADVNPKSPIPNPKPDIEISKSKVQNPRPEAPPSAAATEPASPAPPVLQSAIPTPLPESPKSETENPKSLKILDLEPLVPTPGVAFDESKTTKEAPKNGYLSDRTSTAADKGPKNLPRGDPFMDKGESKAIRYQERRGEGNLPSLAPSETSGSIKKEGSPDAGQGTQDIRPPDTKQPLDAQFLPPAADKKPVEPKTVITPPSPKPPETKAREPKTSLAAAATTEETKLDPNSLGASPKPTAAKPEPHDPVKSILDSPALAVADNTRGMPAPPPAKSNPAKPDALDELKAFAALLDGKGRTAGRGGNVGSKAGVNARPGERGHEGDGTLRPGHDEAVSDVTTINLESSAEAFDDARFAKIFDPKTAYVKPLARRIDGKWKAERVARGRFRFVPGVVTFKVVVRKDGKLLSATEASRSPKDIPDEYSADAKIAIERAAEPLSEPFPPALSEHETLEFVFNFLY